MTVHPSGGSHACRQHLSQPAPGMSTRGELLNCRSAVRFARQGRDLIWDKRVALVREFHDLEVDLLAELSVLAGQAAVAHRMLQEAVEADGVPAVAAAALASSTGVEVRLTSRSVAGVPVVRQEHAPVQRSPESRGWAPVLVSARVDAAAAAYERYLELLLTLSVLELSVRRLATEIARSTRQVNALENVVIPRLEGEARAIVVALEEREREDHARLKRARDRRRAGGAR